MRCSQCASEDTKVIESRDVTDGKAIRRRRACLQCRNRFTTYERVERPQLIVVKHNGTRELFNREKLLSGLYRASEKTPVSSLQLERLVGRVEDKLYACGDQEVLSTTIGQMAMDELADINEVAYVRFASVYRRFEDIAGFERELSQIRLRRHELPASAPGVAGTETGALGEPREPVVGTIAGNTERDHVKVKHT